MSDLNKRDNETQEEYILRIGDACVSGNLTWAKAAEYLNQAFGSNYGECKYRKTFKAWKAGYDYAQQTCSDDTVKEELRQIRLERVKARDERAAMNKVYREVARAESIKEIIEKAVQSYTPDKFLNVVQYDKGEHDAIVCLSDLHAGIGIDTAWNKFNQDILSSRLENYLAQITNIVSRHEVKTIHVLLLGDLISGHIHINSRVANNESSIEQVMLISELLSNFLAELNRICADINVYSVCGNHSRLFPNKDENMPEDNLEAIIPFYLKARLQKIDSITIHDNQLDPSVGGFKARKSFIMYAHGDKDSPSSVAERFTMIVKRPIDMIFLGHRHANGLTTANGTKVIESGCVCGSDAYAAGLRKVDVPQQVVAIIDDDGLSCLYDVKLEKSPNIVI